VDVAEVVRTAAAVIGSGSVVVAARALRHTRQQARTAFEDSLAREYRDIAGRLPPAAFFQHGQAQLNEEQKQALFRYFDLSNEQLRLIEEERIRPETAGVWTAGISALMARDTFRRYWQELHRGLPSDFFSSLEASYNKLELANSIEEETVDGA